MELPLQDGQTPKPLAGLGLEDAWCDLENIGVIGDNYMKLTVNVPMKRMLDRHGAAEYCNLPFTRFANVCPVEPVQLYDNGSPSYDVHDLDRWIDAIKRGGKSTSSIHSLINDRL